MADLLVGDKRHLDGGVGQLGVGDQTRQERADLCHAGLVVSREERRAVGAHDVLALELGQVRYLIRRGLDGLVVDDAGHQRATLVVDDVGLDAGGRGVLGGVEMGAEHERGGVLGALGGGQSAGHVGMLINLHINAANGTQLFSHDLGHLVLSGRRGRLRLVVRVGLGIYLHVAHEALDDVTHGASWRCAHGRAARPPAPGAGLVWVRFYSKRARPR